MPLYIQAVELSCFALKFSFVMLRLSGPPRGTSRAARHGGLELELVGQRVYLESVQPANSNVKHTSNITTSILQQHTPHREDQIFLQRLVEEETSLLFATKGTCLTTYTS